MTDLTQASHRVHNFSAGPATLPLPVLQTAQAEMLDYRGSGMSVLEMSHRSEPFEAILAQAEANLRRLLDIPPQYKVLFQQGGASLQFAMVPLNLRPTGASADYLINGAWGKAAFKDARRLGNARSAATTEAENFNCTSAPSDLDLDPQAAYLHYTSNETIHGVQYQQAPLSLAGVPLVCDMSSDFLSQPVDIARYGLIYAGAQKNAGPAGVTMVILHEDLLERVPDTLPVMLDYRVQAAGGSMHNTPPTFAIYLVGLVLEWLRELGGLPAIARQNQMKADLLYTTIDQSGGFYRGHAQLDSRSLMNVTFRLPTEDLEKQFASSADMNGLVGLKGHRSIGGLRASIYNACPLEAVQALAQFMREFQRQNG
ncbi:MAG TPA: 3-phosphoserine/phosphohydroxythreonine transaminase [Anaerolineales bacterium]|nr:3-phosphoserine/phosphohydroxythreonine transaminase [Anaerolineales bacterium]